MLTGELVRANVVKRTIQPGFIDPDSTRLQERSAALIALMQRGLDEARTRGQLGAEINELVGTDTDHKITKGMAKLLMDRGEFETRSPIEPGVLRQAVFARAAVMGPISRTSGPTGRRTASDVLTEFAHQYDCTPEEIRAALYADLKDHQVLSSAKIPGPEALLHRYNLALIQALLLRATRLELELTQPKPKSVRQLLRYLKFYQLMYRCSPTDNGLRVEVDGPQSLLRLSTRYGMQLANFFPAIVLQPGPWRAEAEVMWGKKRKFKKALVVDSTRGLVSHYRDTGTWTSRTETWFVERFEKLDSDWKMGPGEPIDLGNQALLVPDFTFRKGGRVGHLEIIGFWRKRHLEQTLKALPDNVVLAVSSKLAGEAGGLGKALESQVIRFAEVIPPAKVIDRLEKIAR